MPNKLKVKVEAIIRDEKEVQSVQLGENLWLRVTGVEDKDISSGFVLSSSKQPVPCVMQFEAQLMIVELLEHNPVFTASGHGGSEVGAAGGYGRREKGKGVGRKGWRRLLFSVEEECSSHGHGV